MRRGTEDGDGEGVYVLSRTKWSQFQQSTNTVKSALGSYKRKWEGDGVVPCDMTLFRI
jgi:hypothetical protein